MRQDDHDREVAVQSTTPAPPVVTEVRPVGLVGVPVTAGGFVLVRLPATVQVKQTINGVVYTQT